MRQIEARFGIQRDITSRPMECRVPIEGTWCPSNWEMVKAKLFEESLREEQRQKEKEIKKIRYPWEISYPRKP